MKRLKDKKQQNENASKSRDNGLIGAFLLFLVVRIIEFILDV